MSLRHVAIIVGSFLAFPAMAFADMELNVSLRTEQVDTTVITVGTLEVDGVGQVTLTARRIHQDLFITARDSAENTVGQAKTLVGLRETSIYLTTPEGLEKITILWGQSK